MTSRDPAPTPLILSREHQRIRALVVEASPGLVDEDQSAIERLANLATFALHMRDYAAVLARQAHAEGCSWASIGAVVGVGHETARRRYSEP